MEFLLPLSFQKLSFNTTSTFTTSTNTIIQPVIVLFTVRSIADDIELGTRKWVLAGSTDETFLVVPACQPSVC